MRIPLSGVFEKMLGVGAMKSEEELAKLSKSLRKENLKIDVEKIAKTGDSSGEEVPPPPAPLPAAPQEPQQ